MTILFSSGLRTAAYRKHWPALVRMYGQTCYYCGEFATCIDHIIPASFGGSNDISNLVLACSFCNLLATDMVFNDVDEKGDYIRARRLKKHRTTRAICTECLLPFDYRVLSPSLFLCADCYDRDEGQKKYSIRRSWRQWLALLDLAGVPVEAHQALRKYRLKSKRQKLITLVQLAYYGETQ